jgi:hypothetical protein
MAKFQDRSVIMQSLAADKVVRAAMEIIVEITAMMRLADRSGEERPTINLDKYTARGIDPAVAELLKCLYGGSGPFDPATTDRAIAVRAAGSIAQAMRDIAPDPGDTA